MNDRELLELAAKAANIFGQWTDYYDGDYYSEYNGATGIIVREESGNYIVWNPLTDDGDALRLAVKLGIFVVPEFNHFLALERFARQEDDDVVAHRRAIVRAAAEIGKAMK